MAGAMTGSAPGDRYLIFLICIGEAFRRFAAMAVTSIREVGKWPYDIVLLSDSEGPLAGCPDVTVMDMFSAAKRRYPWLTLHRHALHHLKTEIEYHVDLTRYDYVLYLDCDVLVNSDRLTDLVATFCREQAIVVQQDNIPVASGFGFAGGLILSKTERRQWGAFAINAGIFGLPMNPLGRRLLRDWRQLNVDQQFTKRDQGNLVALLLRKYYGLWGYIGDTTFGRRLERYPETFVHFTTHKDQLMEPYYTQVLGLTVPIA
jgi:hypothetical protein